MRQCLAFETAEECEGQLKGLSTNITHVLILAMARHIFSMPCSRPSKATSSVRSLSLAKNAVHSTSSNYFKASMFTCK